MKKESNTTKRTGCPASLPLTESNSDDMGMKPTGKGSVPSGLPCPKKSGIASSMTMERFFDFQK